jgi:hypothetical protein
MKMRQLVLAGALAGIVWGVAIPSGASIVAPELADFNNDNYVSHLDINLLAAAAADWENETAPNIADYAMYDLNGDDEITFEIGPNVTNPDSADDFFSDSDVLIRDILATQYGDANLDGRVSLLDLITLATHFRRSGDFGWADGNFDGSQGSPRVYLGDLLAMALNWRFQDQSGSVERVVIDGGGAIEVSHSPEPVSWQVWLVGVLCVYCFRSRRAKRIAS